MNDATQRIKISVGHGYMMSIIQLPGDLFVECALLAPDGISLRDSDFVYFGPANHLNEPYDDVKSRDIWQYVQPAMLVQLIRGAIAHASTHADAHGSLPNP